MIINKTHHLMGDQFSKNVKRKSLLELTCLIVIVILKINTNLIIQFHIISIIVTIIAGIFFLYHLYLIIFYDLRIIFISRLMKQNFNDSTNHLKLFRKDNQNDLKEFSNKYHYLTINLYIINHRNIIYTNSLIVSENLKLLYIIHTNKGKEYIYEVLPKKNKA
ncbi:MAG: hypothetical protein K0Q49_1102 [Haloplasmataceae bacterium]|jgi:hypothetical protein|nr:hypothetical protein [Haloplasmataceae bacterium]